MQYNDVVYTPGKDPKLPEFKEKDPVLEQAIEILTGKVTLQEAKAKAEASAQERKTKKSDKKDKKPKETSAK